MQRIYAIGVAWLASMGCSGREDTSGCVRNEQVSCVLSNGEPGFQVCGDSKSFGACGALADDSGGRAGSGAVAGASAAGGAPNPAAGSGQAPARGEGTALQEQLQNRRFEWESFESSSNGSTQAFSELILCESGAFALNQRDNSFFPGSGSVQGENSYAGTWAVTTEAGAHVLELSISQPTDDEVSSPLRFGVEVSGGQYLFADNYNLPNTSPASVADASAECAAPSPPSADGGADNPGTPVASTSCADLPQPEDACGECLSASCCTELQACVAGTACAALLQCLEVCPLLDEACVQSECPAEVAGGVSPATALLECNSAFCGQSCGG